MDRFALSPTLDPARIARAFAVDRRIQIPDFLASDGAQPLAAELAAHPHWLLTANRGDQVIDFTPERIAGMDADARGKLARAVALGGRYGFQFCYETIRLRGEGDPASLARFAAFMSSDPALAFLRTLTGDARIDFADAHASRYGPGHFLTAHDDEVAAMGRRAAYVLNLSPDWRIDWGGLLLFHDASGNITGGFTPRFNTLNVFSVPQAHSVSFVTPLAGAPRYAVTGWLRSGAAG